VSPQSDRVLREDHRQVGFSGVSSGFLLWGLSGVSLEMVNIWVVQGLENQMVQNVYLVYRLYGQTDRIGKSLDIHQYNGKLEHISIL
jgi:hypothetical protein